MRYFSLLFFAVFLVFCVDFATQNTDPIKLIYNLEWLNFIFKVERPIFVPIFFTFALGIIFSVLYFFIYHALLLRNLRLKKKEIKKLERLLEEERNKNDSLGEGKNEIQHNIENVSKNLNTSSDRELDVLEDVDNNFLEK